MRSDGKGSGGNGARATRCWLSPLTLVIMKSGFSDQFLLEAERHSVWGAAQLEVLMEFLPEAPWSADLPTCSYQQGRCSYGSVSLGRTTWRGVPGCGAGQIRGSGE